MKPCSLLLFALVGLSLGALRAQSNDTNVYALTAFAGSAGLLGTTDGTGSSARFSYPTGVAVDGAGNVYVADTNNNTIRKVTSTGVVTTIAGAAGLSGSTDAVGSAARFSGPMGLAVDSVGNIYVADASNHAIRKVTIAGVVTTLAGSARSSGSTDGTGSAARFFLPEGVAVDGAGNVYVADTNNNTIRKVTSTGVVTTIAGAAGLSGSTDAVGSAARFLGPRGLAVDGAGNVYVAEYASQPITNRIRKVTRAGVVTTLAGLSPGYRDGTGSAAAFFAPQGVAVDAFGNVYVADSANNKIRKVTSTGVVTTVGGLAGSSGSTDGTGSAARFSFPQGVAVDALGNVYVSSNSTILKGLPIPTFAIFELKAGFTEAPPSYVNVVFQLKDSTGRGLNLPRELLDQTSVFQVKENGAAISPSESFLQVAKFGEVPSKVRTILLLDNSFSVGANLATIKTAAKALVDRMFAEQEIAVYSFSSTHTLVKDFTGKSAADQQALKAAIDSVTLGAPTTNLYGSILQMLSLPQWKESFSLSGIETGFLVVMTDGSDQAGLATLSDVVAKRDGEKKQIFTLGLGAEIDVAALRSLGNAGYIPAAQVSDLVTAFAATQTNIESGANSFYWLNYASPKRGDFTRTLTVSLANNTNTTPAGTLTYSFNSKLFSDVASAVVINRNVNTASGASSFTLSNDSSSLVRAFTMLPPLGAPAYTWSIADGSLATVVSSGVDGSRGTITAKGVDGVTSLTLTDTVNRTSRTIPLVIGTGTAPTYSRLINLSILTSITDQGESFTMGYVLGGAGTIGAKPLVIRAAGPSLLAHGVEGTLADPMIELFSGAIKSGENDNWGGSSAISSAMAGVGAFPFSGAASRDAATSLSVATRDNSVKVSAVGTGTGVVIAEIYDASPTGTINSTTPRLINVSVLKQLGEILTAGFVVGGTGTKAVLIRAIGPGLSTFGIGGIVTDPKLELFDGSSKRIGLNDNWGGTPELSAAFAAVGAFGLDASSKDAAIVTPLQPGNYSVQVSGIAGTTGIALVEIYEVP